MHKKFFKVTLLIMSLLMLSNCTDRKSCVAAEDFGLDKFSILARGKNIQGERENQFVEWEDSGLVTDGKRLVVVVEGGDGVKSDARDDSEWTSWKCPGGDGVKVCEMMKKYYNKITCTTKFKHWNFLQKEDSTDKYGLVENAPCIFRRGVGLYMLIVDPTSFPQNPNENKYVNTNPKSIGKTFHLGETTTSLSYMGQSDLGGYSADLKNVSKYSRIYFKILDNYYEDNAGRYRVVIKSGAINPYPGPIERVINYIRDKMNVMAKTMYEAIVQNSEYTSALRYLLILFLIITGASFATGIIEITQKEYITRMFKIVVVTFLLTDQKSYDFFNNHFFKIFTNGLDEMVNIIVGGTNKNEGLSFFDNVIGLFLSGETTAKILSLLTANFAIGLFLIPIIYIAIAIIVIGLAKAVVFYLTAYVAITMLIVLAPIFLTFLLFGYTRSLFQSWIKQLCSYLIQPLILFAAVGLLSQVLINSIQKLLGYQVCWENIIKVLDLEVLNWWKITDIKKTKATIELPGYVTDPKDPNKICEPYTCTGERYIDLPFLDPGNSAEQKMIDNFIAKDYSFMIVEGLVLLVLSYLLYKFNDMVPSIARGIAGAEVAQANLGSAAQSTGKALGNIVSAPIKAVDMYINYKTQGQWNKFKEQVRGIKNAPSEKMERMQDKIAENIDKAKPNVLKDSDKLSDAINEKRDVIGSKFDKLVEAKEQAIADVSKAILGDKDAESPFGVDHRYEKKKFEKKLKDIEDGKS